MQESGAPNPKRRWQRRGADAGDAEEKGGYEQRVLAGGENFWGFEENSSAL